MEVAIETPVKKPKRLTSAVWNHFERVRKADICYAVCIHCKKKLSGSSNSGTTHLRNHLIRCLKRSNFDVSQILAAKRKRKDNNSLDLPNVSYDEVKRKAEAIIPIAAAYRYDNEQKKDEPVNLGSIKFDQERSRLDLARMIMLHGYPLGMVDHLGFKIFVKNLQPSFEILTNSGVEFDCMKIYEKEKQKVYEMLRNFHGRISMAVGKWVSPENEEYMCLTANFVDADWKFQKKTLNFITLDSSHTDDTLSEVVIKCLMNWEIDRKLFSLTFDDCSISDEVARGVKDWISQNKPLLKNGELFDVRCASHFLKSLVREAIEALQEVCCKIRETIRYVKSSQATQGKFYEIANEVGINSEKRLFLDTPMTWNSTYLMLETALEYRGAFSLLQEHDPAYYTTLIEEDWELASSVASYMKLFVEIINSWRLARAAECLTIISPHSMLILEKLWYVVKIGCILNQKIQANSPALQYCLWLLKLINHMYRFLIL
ncbi:zinc finger BED domain-containing protein RICESLEEPER 1-like [Heracleum sosnowskyi]|uniref:Zinc finger BED domain-containing protein RICESLEEPER 1-like n=1 Tax=Heracleum sosnowskyi TaxID=360622 RepID=A0AAD8M7I2_9APIA|nr:zinc finger BED domain-containing protein RICESLEEPER 1-like [Heracleum sosnowskyi]